MSPAAAPTPVQRVLIIPGGPEGPAGFSGAPGAYDLAASHAVESSEELVRELTGLIESNPECAIRVVRSPLAEIPLRIDSFKQSILLFVITHPDQLRAQLDFLRSLRIYIEDGNVILMALNRLSHPDVPKILKKMGYAEVISHASIRASGLKARLEILFSEFEHPELFSYENDPFATPFLSRLVDGESPFEFMEPLRIQEDCWLLRHPDDVRIVRGHWVVNLIGPGPVAGLWRRRDAAPLRQSDGHSVWEWAPKNLQLLGADGAPLSGDGSWVFWGKKPRFDEFHWTFISRNPRLSFFRGEEAIGDFFALNRDRTLLVAQNSDIAIAKWPKIHASILGKLKIEGTPGIPELPAWSDLVESSRNPEKTAPAKVSRFFLLSRIQKELEPRENLFNRVEGLRGRESYLQELSATVAPVQVWTRRQKLRCKARVTGARVDEGRIIVHIGRKQHYFDLKESAGKDGKAQIFFNIGLERGGIFFAVEAGKLAFEGDGKVTATLPADLYEVQRRLYFRLEVPKEQGFAVTIGGQPFRIHKISAGGISFFADASLRSRFAQGTVLEEASFAINSRKIRCQLEVRWNQVFDDGVPGENLIVGAQYQGLKSSEKQRLNLFILEARFDYLRGLLPDE